ncbi:DUF3040 domain-containing protein [Aeromicrobium sp. 636]|uniref:DUF3040 domain-containing protein n=1 Tax=Aeromicrobium senzhongii TaxID=2663859 RepID=A0A8I0ETS7_9ACTN|nr:MULTISPECIES: DUF3040 domain-containing protein [Aeromicrobium]MBC9225453.1 DUF3040 domain-containing protein [Aeromicrobium senzhongii]MCQ3997563.1 DUF3040 domain-containing protein [Aeromicrobium sp. 636]MTB87489.1 DUF3040 domain-containing protein [Aeromicrobium senzhongii]QNL95464.1 DUF3040 domain-containing protein [Aeromicrobium senzhongii]
MPLSDEEARLLAQLEQSLAEEDPEFASTLRGSKLIAHNRRVAAICVVGFLAGIAMLLGGAVSKMTWIGAAGFVVMVASAYLFVRAWRRGISGAQEPTRPTPSSPRGPKGSGSFVERMEERWQRRQDDGY